MGPPPGGRRGAPVPAGLADLRGLRLAWEDLDLDAGTANLRRASVYIDGRGQQLGPPKTEGAHDEHFLMPTVVELLARRQAEQAEERASAPEWSTHTYEGQAVDLVFTTPAGGLVLRQSVSKLIKQAANCRHRG